MIPQDPRPVHPRKILTVLVLVSLLTFGVCFNRFQELILFRIAHDAYNRCDYQTAEMFWRLVLAKMKLSNRDWNSNIEYWCALCWLGNMQCERGLLGDSENLLNEGLAVSKRVRTPGHFVVPNTMLFLADLYAAQGRPDDARAMVEKAIQLREQADKGVLPSTKNY
ncbi:MAG: tetratricopeptide repeat protein [Cyanobacteria bacterium HKST-UBA02]|nr:tetratricopeptide repeat protein [Cyanobacteria bacterium HKST-UBA02]